MPPQRRVSWPTSGTTRSGGAPSSRARRTQRLLRVYRTPWEGRNEDKADDSVWAVTCVVVRAGHRRQGIAYGLARAAVEHARSHGAHALEAYPMLKSAGEITWDEIHVGAESIFEAAGMTEVSRPGKRRAVMRIDF